MSLLKFSFMDGYTYSSLATVITCVITIYALRRLKAVLRGKVVTLFGTNLAFRSHFRSTTL
jgi:hypothetical protein